MKTMLFKCLIAVALLTLWGCGESQQPVPQTGADTQAEAQYDTLIRGGTLYDGSGSPGVVADIAIKGDRIAALGDLSDATAAETIDAKGMAVTPGFINMLSWATVSLIEDGRGLSDVAQGVTLEVFGEGWSMGPLNDAMKAENLERQTDIQYDIEWTTLGEYLDYLEERGVSPNVASFVGATTLRIKHLGYEDRAPTPAELEAMRADVALAMEEGAMGVGSSLIYTPAFYADTEELIALVDTAEDYGGSYISHMRSEGNQIMEAVDEMLEIAQATGAGVEIYHLKAAGKDNWPKMDQLIAKVNEARANGIDIRADMYTYTAGSTGLNAAMPPWVQEGGHDAWVERLKDPEIRARLFKEIETPTDAWENAYLASGGAEGVLFVGFRNPELHPLIGKTLAEVAEMRGTTPAETIIDLVIEDNSRVECVYFMMSEENIPKQIAQPWVSFQSDAGAPAPEGVFLQQSTHPRAYGTFARLLGKYVREQAVISLPEAIRRLTSLPANNLKIKDRGLLKAGYYADIVVFNPETIQDHATFVEPHQLATGVEHVLINGVQVLRNGQHTGATPGRVVRGPGYVGAIETVTLETTSGDIDIKLYPGKAPASVANFLAYVDGGHYNGATLYRVVRDDNQSTSGKYEVVQGGLLGEPIRAFLGGEDKSIFPEEPPFPPAAHERTDATGLINGYGVIAMARNEPGSATSEFFFNLADNPGLDAGEGSLNPDGEGYAAFGRVSRGMDVLEVILSKRTLTGEQAQILAEPAKILRAYRKGSQ